MAEEKIKKTAEAHGTVSEELALERAEDALAVSEKMIDKKLAEEKKEKEIREKEMEKRFDEKQKEIAENKKLSSRQARIEEEKLLSLKAWEPKTKLGKQVRSGEIRDIDFILDNNKKILEEQIVDLLLPVETDLIAIGQSKGKFGGGKRRAWRQTQRITREGGVMTFSAMAVVGDRNGHIGIGTGKAGETLPARDKATRQAKLNIMKITRACGAFDCSCSEPHTIPFKVSGKSGSVRIELIPAPQGTGLVVANELKKVLRLAGIEDVYSKTFGRVRTTFNLVKACIRALEETNRK